MSRILASIVISLSLLTGCSFVENNGAGLDLYSSDTARATDNLSAYFKQICAQSNLLPSDSSQHCSNYPTLVRTGFNDIDLRCDRYLALIDNKRLEAQRFRSSITASNTALTGILTISNPGSNTIAYIGQILGFASSIYDANANSLLLGLETSTIKRIVYQRRLEFRKQFANVPFTNTPDMVFALRGYLRICTPQTIVLDANTYALAGASGSAITPLSERISAEVEAISGGRAPVTPQSLVTQRIVRSKVVCKECQAIVAAPGFTRNRIRALQTALCVKADGKSGGATFAGVQSYRDAKRSERKGLISEAEYSDILTYGCKAGDRERGFRNFYEAAVFRDNPNELVTLVDNLNILLPDNALDRNTVTLNSGPLRQKIARARGLVEMNTGDGTQDTFLSRRLKDRISKETN